MLCVWVQHGCDPGKVSDDSRLALYQNLSIECPSSISFWHVLCVVVPFFLSFFVLFCFCFVVMLSLELCRCSSDIFLSSRPRTPDWQPRILLGMVEARSINVKNTTATTTYMGKERCTSIGPW